MYWKGRRGVDVRGSEVGGLRWKGMEWNTSGLAAAAVRNK